MSLTLTQRPGNNTWVASSVPILYKLTRKDFTWTSLVTSAGKIQITTSSATGWAVGDVVWLQSDDGAYSLTSTIFSIVTTTIVLNASYVANNASGYINNMTARKNYYVATDIFTDTGAPITTNSIVNTPDKLGNVIIDIHVMVNAMMDAQFLQSLGSIVGDTSVDQGFYIQYTEFWTGSANSPTSDSANISYAAFAAKQIGEDGFLTPYSTGQKFLTKFDRLLITLGEYYALSWIDNSAVANMFIKKYWQLPGIGTFAATFTKSNISAAKGVYTYTQQLPVENNWPWAEPLGPDRNVGAGTAWSGNPGSVTIATASSSAAWCTPIFMPWSNTIQYTFNWAVNISTGAGAGCNLVLAWYTTAGALINSVTLSSTLVTGTNSGSTTITIPPTNNAAFVGLIFNNVSTGVNQTVNFTSLSLNIPVVPLNIFFQAENVSTATPYVETALATNLYGDIDKDTTQPVTLLWRNSVGGLSSWTFAFSQDKQYVFDNNTKNKNLTLYDTGLSPQQWEALQELNTVGDTYDIPIIENLTTLTRTKAKRGQQVYVVDQSGNKVGVIVINNSNPVRTRETQSTVNLSINYPEYFQQL